MLSALEQIEPCERETNPGKESSQKKRYDRQGDGSDPVKVFDAQGSEMERFSSRSESGLSRAVNARF